MKHQTNAFAVRAFAGGAAFFLRLDPEQVGVALSTAVNSQITD